MYSAIWLRTAALSEQNNVSLDLFFGGLEMMSIILCICICYDKVRKKVSDRCVSETKQQRRVSSMLHLAMLSF